MRGLYEDRDLEEAKETNQYCETHESETGEENELPSKWIEMNLVPRIEMTDAGTEILIELNQCG